MKESMRTIVLGLLLSFCLFCLYGQGNAQMIQGYEWGVDVLWNAEDIFTAATDTTLSSAIRVGPSQYFGVYYQAVSSSATPNVTIEFLECYTKAGTYVIPENAPAIVSGLTNETVHVKSIQPSPMPWMKIRVRGLTGNAIDTKILFVLITQPSRGR